MKNIRIFLSENFQFLVVTFSVYLNRHVFVMVDSDKTVHPRSLIGVFSGLCVVANDPNIFRPAAKTQISLRGCARRSDWPLDTCAVL